MGRNFFISVTLCLTGAIGLSGIAGLSGVLPSMAQDEELSPIPPLEEIIDGKAAYIDAATFRSRFSEICDTYGQDAMTNALAPFKDTETLDKAIEAIPDEAYFKEYFRYMLADVFWEGSCVHQDRDFTRSIYNGLAFTMGYGIARDRAMRLHSRKFDQLMAEDMDALTSSSRPLWDAQVHRLYDAAQFSPQLLEEPVLDDEEIEAINNDRRIPLSALSRDVPPAQREAAILRQILDLELEAPLSVAASLKAGQFDIPYANSLAFIWLNAAQEPPFENPLAVHMFALWGRDVGFRKRRLEEAYVADQKSKDLAAANASLKYALMMEDRSLVPLAYCLLDHQFQHRKNSAAAKQAYALLMWLKENDQPYPENRLQALEDELSFFQRWGLDGKSIIDIDDTLLPMDDVDLTECAAATGQTEFWKAEGLL